MKKSSVLILDGFKPLLGNQIDKGFENKCSTASVWFCLAVPLSAMKNSGFLRHQVQIIIVANDLRVWVGINVLASCGFRHLHRSIDCGARRHELR
ncbi:hypothetical protein DHW03_08900 [Pedobacter yonginense]|uniref:Uncharacterized protein n=1 Tax=Pedobacter yonginense TaxID=651869 RepID=A0A317ELF2_9SPHI|nr:hypothetical protein DHW03_08900 [Pedobacter yonginense]